jgi:hypothetical protein
VVVLAGCDGAPAASSGSPPGDAHPPDGDRGDAGDDTGTDARDATPSDGQPHPGLADLVQLCGAIPVDFEAWETCYRRRLCEWALNCDPLGRFSTVQECIQLIDAESRGAVAAQIAERRRAVSMGRASIDTWAFAQCLRETDPTKCKTAKYHVDCAERFAGTIEDGGSCYSDVECKSAGFPEPVFGRYTGAWCERDCVDACCVGRCRRAAQEGDSCADGRWCEADLRCSIDGRCLSGDAGTHCRHNNDCDRGLWCEQPAPLQPGRCAAQLAIGEVCQSHFQCPGDWLCIAPMAGAKARCARTDAPGAFCNGDCYGKMYCELSGVTGHCRELRKLNETCDNVARCDSVTTVCSQGICVARVAEGRACATETCMPGLFCSSELGSLAPGDPAPTCLVPQPAGARCTKEHQCASFICGPQGLCLPDSDTCPPGP